MNLSHIYFREINPLESVRDSVSPQSTLPGQEETREIGPVQNLSLIRFKFKHEATKFPGVFRGVGGAVMQRFQGQQCRASLDRQAQACATWHARAVVSDVGTSEAGCKPAAGLETCPTWDSTNPLGNLPRMSGPETGAGLRAYFMKPLMPLPVAESSSLRTSSSASSFRPSGLRRACTSGRTRRFWYCCWGLSPRV